MEYRVEELDSFKVIGISKEIKMEEGYSECPKLWDYFMKQNYKSIFGKYGICFDDNKDSFTYVIADDLVKGKRYEKGLEVLTIPKKTWLIFPCLGALPDSIQKTNTYIFKEFFVNNKEYEMDGKLNIEYYTDPEFFEKGNQDPSYYTEIWIPVKKK